MNKKNPRKIIFGAAILTLALICARAPQIAGAQTQSTPPPDAGAISSNAENSITPATLPPDIDPNSPLGQLVRMAQSGVDQSIMLAYINNSSQPFNLNSDQIIYLNDLGVPDEIVTAMIQRDQQLGVAVNTQPSPPATTEETQQPTDVDENYFYDTLAPYGGWVNIEGYGLCWQPSVVIYNGGWQPYCDHGHWVYTDDGWYWMSDYSWGWATFHYGRWFHDSHRGWCWWPNTTWGPSWVCWRYSQDYCGWAPLPPHTAYRTGVGIVFNGKAVSAGFDFGIGANFFTFVPTRDFCDPHPDRFRVRSADAAKIYGRTKVINNINANNRTIVNDGIPISRIAAASGRPIHAVTIQATTSVAPRGARGEQLGRDGHTLVVNRPHFNTTTATTLNNGVRPRPAPMTPRPQTPVNHGNQNNNTTQPLIIYGNGNNSMPRASVPQNNYARPPANQNPQERNNTTPPARSYWSTPEQTPAPNNNYQQRYTSPRMREQSPIIPQPEERAAPTPRQEPQHPQFNNSAPHNESRSAPTPPVQNAPARATPQQSGSQQQNDGNRNH